MSPTTVYIAWDPPVEMTREMDSYNVKYYRNGEAESDARVVPTTALEINITDLEPSTTYNIFVTARIEATEGERSQIMVIETGIDFSCCNALHQFKNSLE